MPVEISRIKGRLKALYPKANLSTKRLDEIAARLAKKPADDAEDSAIDELLNEANDVYPFEEMAKDEHRLATAENKLKKQKPAKSPDQEEEEEEEPATQPTDDMPKWAKTMLESNQKLAQDLAELKAGKITESKKEAAKKLFDGNETLKNLKESVKEKWFNRIDVNSETPVEDQISDLESEYTELVQGTADSKSYPGAPPNSKADTKPTDAEVDDLVESL